MSNLKLKNRGGFGKPKTGGVRYITIRLAYEIVHETPWDCFATIARAARCKGIPSSLLTLQDARDLGHVWHLVFEVDQ